MNKYINYRPEIDGLRAIAVLSVIFYHSTLTLFEKKFLPGGFIGVDIFFIISGYLITKIIINEVEITKKFSFLNFYKRRIKRIIPALFFVIIFTFPFIYQLTLPVFFLEYLESIIYTVFFSSNIYFWNLGTGYDQLQDVYFQPFLHAWTLSLEEQFYIVFPFIFVFIYKKFYKNLNFLIIIGFLSSFFLADYMSYTHSAANFYFLPTRAWEFLTGSILVLIERKNLRFILNQKYSSYFICTGFSFIIFSLIFFDDRMFLPSIVTLIPVMGTSFIILFSKKKNFLIKIFSTKLFIGIGLISYSLYLWHYPIFIIYPNISFLYQISLIFLLSVFSYFFIEKKFRTKKKSSFYSIKTIFASSLLILIVASFFLKIGNNHNFEKYPEIIQNSLEKREKGRGRIIDSLFKKDFTELKKNLVLNDEGPLNKKNLFIVGDSHMSVLASALRKKENDKINDYNFIPQNLSGGCYYVYNFKKIDYFKKKDLPTCTKKDQEERRNNFLAKKDSIVIMGGRLPRYLSSEGIKISRYFDLKPSFKSEQLFKNSNNLSLQEGVLNTIRDLLKNDVKVILIYPVPTLSFNPVKKIFDRYVHNKKSFLLELIVNPLTMSYSSFLETAKESHNLLDSINHPNLYRVRTHQLFCDLKDNACKTHEKESIFYIDNNHLSADGNQKVISVIFKKLELIENNKKDN